MRVEVGVKESSKNREDIGEEHMGRSCRKMADEKLAKRADAQKVEGKWREEGRTEKEKVTQAY